jgi:hypothetical protein
MNELSLPYVPYKKERKTITSNCMSDRSMKDDEEQRVRSMKRKNAQEIFGLLNKFSFSCVRSDVSLSLSLSLNVLLHTPLLLLLLCVSICFVSHSHEGINHRETIADDLNERNLHLRSLLRVIDCSNKTNANEKERRKGKRKKERERERKKGRNGEQIRNNINEVIFRQVLDNQTVEKKKSRGKRRSKEGKERKPIDNRFTS